MVASEGMAIIHGQSTAAKARMVPSVASEGMGIIHGQSTAAMARTAPSVASEGLGIIHGQSTAAMAKMVPSVASEGLAIIHGQSTAARVRMVPSGMPKMRLDSPRRTARACLTGAQDNMRASVLSFRRIQARVIPAAKILAQTALGKVRTWATKIT